MNNRAYMHGHGLGGAINYPEAIRLFEQAIALGNADAMNNRAAMYHKGLGGTVNYPEAIRLYEQAIALGNAVAMRNRTFMHEQGLGNSSKDVSQLLDLLWDDLLRGISFSRETMWLFGQDCKAEVLNKLTDEHTITGTSLKRLEPIISNDDPHPLAQILNDGGEGSSTEYERLKEHVQLVRVRKQQREAALSLADDTTSYLHLLFRGNSIFTGPIMTSIQPGYQEDDEPDATAALK